MYVLRNIKKSKEEIIKVAEKFIGKQVCRPTFFPGMIGKNGELIPGFKIFHKYGEYEIIEQSDGKFTLKVKLVHEKVML